MTRKYSLVIEGVSVGYSAYVPELPTILVTGPFEARWPPNPDNVKMKPWPN
jgi:hypothetical protein